MDKRTRTLITMHQALHPRNDVDRLYLSRKERKRGLASIEDSGNASIQRLENGIEKHEGGLITAILTTRWPTEWWQLRKWEEKQLYGHFKWLINKIFYEKIWTWLRKENFEIETEYLLIAAQNNAIRTHQIKEEICMTPQNSKCRLCGDRDETINYKISECSKLALKEY